MRYLILFRKKIKKEELQKFKDNPLSCYKDYSPQFLAYIKKTNGNKGKRKNEMRISRYDIS